MKIRPIHRAVSLALAAVFTLGLFGGIDHLAGTEGVGAVWAAAAPSARG